MSKKSLTKPHAVRQQVIVDHLCRGIAAGTLSPGDRLPTHEQIQRKFHTTRVTVQRALDRLAAEGFICTKPKVGRFVAERLPYQSRYALVFQGSPDSEAPWTWSRYFSAIIEASRVVAARNHVSFPIYYDVKGHVDSEGYQLLMRDVQAYRLTGLIFPQMPFELEAMPLMERPDPPRVGPADVGAAARRGQFLCRAIDALIADGRRRFALITLPQSSRGLVDEFEAAAASRGAKTYPFWTQAVVPHHTEWVRHAVDAILNTHAAVKPDALVISDDHLVEPVAEALAEFGVRVPQDVRVIGHWNFPLRYRGPVPIDLLGFDAGELLRAWVDVIDAQKRGEKTARLASVPTRFSWELAEIKTESMSTRGGPKPSHFSQTI